MNTLVAEVVEQANEHLADRGIDTSKPGYRNVWQMFTAVGVGMQLDIADRDVDHWATNMGIMRALDDLIDDHGVTCVSDYVNTAVNGHVIPGMTEAEVSLFSEVYDVYTPDRRSKQLGRITSLADFAPLRREAETVRAYRDHTQAESNMGADLMAISGFASHSSGKKEQRSDRWLQHSMNFGFWLDMVLDLPDDYRDGTSKLPPTLCNRAQFASMAAVEAAKALRLTPPNALVRLAQITKQYV